MVVEKYKVRGFILGFALKLQDEIRFEDNFL